MFGLRVDRQDFMVLWVRILRVIMRVLYHYDRDGDCYVIVSTMGDVKEGDGSSMLGMTSNASSHANRKRQRKLHSQSAERQKTFQLVSCPDARTSNGLTFTHSCGKGSHSS